jgi:transcriptional regulator with XRE-family HTH domain
VRGTPWERALARALAEDFVGILRVEMESQGVTQSEMARRLGVSKTQVSQMLHSGNLTLRTMAAALNALDRRLVLRTGRL